MHGARMHYSTVGLYITVHVDTDIADICPTVQYTYVATMYSCAGTAEATYRYYRYLCSIELDLLGVPVWLSLGVVLCVTGMRVNAGAYLIY